MGLKGWWVEGTTEVTKLEKKIFLSLLHKKLVFCRYEYVCRKTWFYMCNGESKAHP